MSNVTFAAPTALWTGVSDPAAPLVVLFHGRGSNERAMIPIASSLSNEVAFASLRGPVTLGPDSYTWFENRGIGRAIPESLRQSLDWFYDWLNDVAPPGRRVVLVGFSGGAAFVGGVMLDQPTRADAFALLYGTVPFDAGLPTAPHQLVGVSVFHAQGVDDQVMPRELMDRTWTYLTQESGADVVAQRTAGGHEWTPDLVDTLSNWIGERLGRSTDS